MFIGEVPSNAVVVKLFRINSREELIACESMLFTSSENFEMILRRAAISGRVELGAEAKIQNHFADLQDKDENLIATVALDAKSYGSLKNKWMRCKVERNEE